MDAGLACPKYLESMQLIDFFVQLNKRLKKPATEEKINEIAQRLEKVHLFKYASELQALSAHDLNALEVPISLIPLIVRVFSGAIQLQSANGQMPSPPQNQLDMLPKEMSNLNLKEESVFGAPAAAPQGDNSQGHLVKVKTMTDSVQDAEEDVEEQIDKKHQIEEEDEVTPDELDDAVIIARGLAMDEEDQSPSLDVEATNGKFDSVGASVCAICKGPPAVPQERAGTLSCGHSFHIKCLISLINALVKSKKAVGIQCPIKKCTKELDPQVIQGLLTPQEFNEYLEATLLAFIDSDNDTYKCPNPKCGSVISMAPPPKNIKIPKVINEKDQKGKPLTPEAYKHFLQHRLRCRDCNSPFCVLCKQHPYHLGYTCDGWKDYQNAKTCRFCHQKLDKNNTAHKPPSEGLKWVCKEEECLRKRAICCTKTLPCGCPCNGTRGEKSCMACIHCEQQNADDYCPICYVEALEDAPCVQSQGQCTHVIHYECIVNKIKARWSSARVEFNFKNCPVCKNEIYHPSLDTILKPIRELEDIISRKSLERLKYENMDHDAELSDKNSPFFNNQQAYAMHKFVFYMCYECHKPYFAGGYQCQEAAADYNPKELICPSCMPAGSCEDCPIHQKDWLVYKCKYCCNISSWYCWGRVHFCAVCHKAGVWNKLSTMGSGRNKKRLWEYSQCKGLKDPIKQILKDKKLSPDQMEAKMEKILSNPKNCPLKVAHPPNGVEFGLGCSMCANKDAVRPEERKAQEEKDKKVKDTFKKKLAGGGREFRFHHDMDENGIIFWLGCGGGSRKWENPHDSGVVRVTSSGLNLNPPSVPVSAVVGRQALRCVTRMMKDAWIQIDLIDKVVRPTKYMIRHYSSWDVEALRFWRFMGSNDGQNWVVLREHVNDNTLRAKGQAYTWSLHVDRPYRMFRILQTGLNSNNHLYLAISGFELYGALSLSSEADNLPQQRLDRQPSQRPSAAANPPPNKADSNLREFRYKHDMDTQGILYHLGTGGGARPYQNPALSGDVVVTHSALMPDSAPAHSIVGREVVRCVSRPVKNSWFVIDIRKPLRPTAYTLRHYSTWDIEALRNWLLQGSSDGGRKWTTLKQHVNDTSLERKGQPFTWSLPGIKEFYSQYRIIMTGLNSNNHMYLSLSGVEFYGFIGMELTWDALKRSPSLQIEQNGTIVKNFGSNDRWVGIRATQSYSSGRHLIEFIIVNDAFSTNTWRFCVGVVPNHWDPTSSKKWVGAQGSWGYAAHGQKVYNKSTGDKYGSTYHKNDVIGILIDFEQRIIEFFKNGASQGVAFRNLDPSVPVYPACSMTGQMSAVGIRKCQL